MADCGQHPRMPNEKVNRLLREVFLAALTAEIEHEHGLADQLLHAHSEPHETIELLFGMLCHYVGYQAHSQGVPPLEIVQRMGMALASEEHP